MKDWISEQEQVVEDVSDWAVKTIMDTIKALGNRPFGQPTKSPERQLEEDYLPIRDDAQGIFNFITGKAQDIINQLQQAGVPPDEVFSISPYNIAVNRWLDFMTEMEGLIQKKHMAAAKVVANLPTIPPSQTEPPPGYTFRTPSLPAPVGE